MSVDESTEKNINTKNVEQSVGPAVSVIIIVVIMIIGGLYFLYTRLNGAI